MGGEKREREDEEEEEGWSRKAEGKEAGIRERKGLLVRR